MKKIIHIDMDCFFAQIEMRDRPELVRLPIAIGGIADGRGVLCTSNYEARKYGVFSAMPTAIALRKCPQLILVPPNFEKYKKVSAEIFDILKSFSKKIETLSLDEAYIDVTNCSKFNNDAVAIAKEIKRRIFGKTKLTASVGISYNKYLAKIGSDFNKPNGLTVIRPERTEEFLAKLSVHKLNGVGEKALQKMRRDGIEYVGDLKRFTKLDLINRFGEFGVRLYGYAYGVDDRDVISDRTRKSLSVEKTFSRDIKNREDLIHYLKCLFEELTSRLKKHDLPVKGIFIKLKHYDFKVFTVQSTDDFEIKNFLRLFLKKWDGEALRLVGMGVQFFVSEEKQQLCFNL